MLGPACRGVYLVGCCLFNGVTVAMPCSFDAPAVDALSESCDPLYCIADVIDQLKPIDPFDGGSALGEVCTTDVICAEDHPERMMVVLPPDLTSPPRDQEGDETGTINARWPTPWPR